MSKMTTSSREECEVDSSSSNMISLFLLETDTQSKHPALKQTQCQTVLLLKGCAGTENGVNGSKMLLTLLPTQVRLLPLPSCLHRCNYSRRPPSEIQDDAKCLARSGGVPSTGGKMRRKQQVVKQICKGSLRQKSGIARNKMHLSFLWSLLAEAGMLPWLHSAWLCLRCSTNC